MHGGEVAIRGDRKAGLDDIDTHLVEEIGDFELLLMRHGRAGALLAVAQGSIEDENAVLLGLDCCRHECGSFSSLAPSFPGAGGVLAVPPERPGANARPALRGP